MINNIADAMIVIRMTVSCFGNSRTDRAAGATVCRAHNADHTAGRYAKHLIDPASLKSVSAAAGRLRAAYMAGSLPYAAGSGGDAERGERLIPARSLPKFRAGIAALMAEYAAAADTFCRDVYPAEVSRAAGRLGTLFDPDQYPADIRAEFSARMTDYPIPDMTKIPAGSWIGLAADHENRMRTELAAAAAAAELAARGEVFRRLQDQISKVADKLAEFNPAGRGSDRGTFRDSLIGNLIDEVSILPDLIPAGNDPELAGILQEVKNKILGSTVETLRTNSAARSGTITAARDIAARLKGLV